MKTLKILLALFLAAGLTSCYEDYVADYEYSSTGFALAYPLRTAIADRDMEIYVGVSIGGKRKVNMKDWATFEIAPELLPEGINYHLLPDNYYTFSDPNTMRVRKSNLPVADVGMKFTEDFYNDVNAINKYYYLPLRITDSSLDSIYRDETIVAIKFISTFHGTYYVKGKLEEIEADTVKTTTVYNNKDLIKNSTCDLQTTTRNILIKPQVTISNPSVISERIQLTFEINDNKDKIYSVSVQQVTGGVNITDGSGTYYGNKKQPEINLNYSFVKGGKNYRVEETLILRQDPLKDFRVESWQAEPQ